MKAIIINLLKSFKHAKGKFILCVLAAFLSAWGISTMLYSSILSDRDFKENFSASNPAEIILAIDSCTKEAIHSISSDENVASIERREAITGRIRNKYGNWMPLLIFAGEEINRPSINKFKIDAKPRDSSIFIERNGSDYLNTKKPLTMQLAGLDSLSLSFNGEAFDPGLAPSQMEQVIYGYTSIRNLGYFINDNSQRLLIKTKKKGLNEDELRKIGKGLAQSLDKTGSKISSLNVPPPGEHPHQNIVNGIAFLQKSFGIIVSLLGIILLSLILITWLYPQISNVGIMKTVGASANMVLFGYTSVLLMIIAIGLLAGLPLGFATAKLYSRFIDFVQNFEPIDAPLKWLDHLLVIVPIILFPMLFAVIPLVQASRTTVHDALNKVFYTPYKKIFAFSDQLFVDTKIKYSINNLFRSSQRTGLLMLLLISGISLFTAGFNLRHSLKTDFENYIKYSNYGVTIIIKDSLKDELSFLNKLPFVVDVKYIKNSGVQFKSPDKSYSQSAVLSSFPPGYQLNPALLIKGAIRPARTDYLYISQKYEPDFKNIPLGSSLPLKYQNGTTEQFVFGGVIKNIVHPGFYRFSLSNNNYNELAIRLKKDFSSSKATQLLDDALMSNDIEVKQIASADSKLLMLENHLKPTYIIIQAMGMVTLAIALLGLLTVLHLSLQERLIEMGIMKAIGSCSSSIINMYHREYLLISFACLIIGISFGELLNAAICNLFGVMVIQVPVVPIMDFKFILLAVLILPAIQTLLISIYVRKKLQQSSAGMISKLG